VVFLSIEQENTAASAAFDVLKKHPAWARVQEGLSRANLKHSQRNAELHTLQLRRREALRHFSFQALTYLDLVSKSETADAFCDLLPLMVREAYVFSCGVPPQVAKPVSEDAHDFERRVEFRFRRWVTKAYQRAQAKGSTKRMRNSSNLLDLAAKFRRDSEPLRALGLKGRADLYAEQGREGWGIWRLIPKNRETEPAWVTFSLLASLALEEFGIPPTSAPNRWSSIRCGRTPRMFQLG
jgi:hypothetical protein